jgi:HK97 gp10 family phage protein
MSKAGIRLEGDKSLHKMLEGLPRGMRTKIMKGSLMAAAKPIVKLAKSKVPENKNKKPRALNGRVVKAGNLAKSIGSKYRKGDSKNSGGYVVIGPKRKTGFYGIMVEKGFKDKSSKKTPFLSKAFNQGKSGAMVKLKAEAIKRLKLEVIRLKRGSR